MHHEIIIAVNDLALCRFFYREIVLLGEPVADSCDNVIFDLGGTNYLMLCRTGATFLEHTSSAVSFAIEHPEFAKIKNKLIEQQYPVVDCGRKAGRESFRTNDPEGNPVLLLSPAD